MDEDSKKKLDEYQDFSDKTFEKLENGSVLKGEKTTENPLMPFPAGKLVNNKTKRKSKTQKSLTVLTRISFILCIACMILSAVTFVDWQKSRSVPDTEQEPMDLCVPCQYLVEDPFNPYGSDPLLDKLNKHMDRAMQMCCANSADQLSMMFEATMRTQKTRPVPEPPSIEKDGAVLKFTPVSAHKLLREPERISDQEGPVFNDSHHFIARLTKEFHDPVTEHARRVTVRENGLIIEHTGYYYVYASAHFLSNSTKFGYDIPKKWWKMYIHRTRPNSPANTGTFMKIEHTVPARSILRNSGHTGFTGGVFHLKKGDFLQACISGQGLVEFGKPSTFIGLSMMTSGPKNG